MSHRTGVGPRTVLLDIACGSGVADIDEAMRMCRSAGSSFELENNNPAPGWAYRRLLIRTPSGYRLAPEGPNE